MLYTEPSLLHLTTISSLLSSLLSETSIPYRIPTRVTDCIFHLEQLLDELQLQRDVLAIVLAPIEGSASDLPALLRRILRLDHLVVLAGLNQSDRCAIVGIL